MKTNYDALIIGGGPAGSTMARILSQGGMDVLVIDKRKEIGVPVRCGEGIGSREVFAQGLEVPKRVIATEIKGAKVYAPNGKTLTWSDESTSGWVIERKLFDKWLCELAIDKGAEVRTYVRATDIIQKNGKPAGLKVVHWGGKEEEIYAPLIISAEGMEARIAKKAGFDTVHRLYDVDTCYQYEMKPYDHENMIELYFGNKIAPRGYVWLFPKSDRRANVGIGIGGNYVNGDKNGIPGADPKKLLDDFIANHKQLKNASTLVDFGGVISVGAPIDEFVKDNFLVVGTAAKQVDPIHGGGIALAMETGVLAADVVLKAHKKKDYSRQSLLPYEKTWKATLGRKMAKRLMVRKVMEKMSDDDFNHVFGTITQNDLNDIMAGNFAKSVAKVVGGRPQLLKVLSTLLQSREIV